ncbi:MAG: fumarylacetoacetate hydrolase family protein [Methyloprofundus sp.]|nr:fumarylacetoacetate hydrolase family protein [Methyloprofundus sp.]MDT8426723.1 fumarylacetoacetate hydrolase family protein [Methyloprofundus sp.]
MKLVTFTYQGLSRVGAVVDNTVVDSLEQADIPPTMLAFLAAGQPALQALQQLIDSQQQRIALSDVKLMAPIPRPGKFLGVGLNYADHIAETALAKPDYPTFFTKQSTCVIAQGEAIHVPKVSEKLDYEVELAFVIGQRCRHVSLENAHKVIAGYTLVNDVSVRDWQFRSPTWTLGKSFDTHGPMGPWIVTADEIRDPHNLNLQTWIDDDLRQSSNTQHMIFNCYEMIAYLTQAMTLEPGDVIATGTPSGVGVKMKPRGYMKAGQTVKIEIEQIGSLINPVIDEPDDFVLPL